MAVSHAGVFVQTPNFTTQSWLNADAANTKKTVVTAGTNGTKVVALTATSTETANSRVAQVWVTRSAVSYLLTSIVVNVNSGFDGTVSSASLMGAWSGLPVDNDGQKYFFLLSGDTLQVSFTTQLATNKEIDVLAVAADF